MYSHVKSLVLVGVPLLTAGAIVLSSTLAGARGQSSPQKTRIPGPSTWVPFAADLRTVADDGTVTVGRFYRNGDGSTRSQTGPSVVEITNIAIKNIPDVRFYTWNKRRGWSEQPMQLPPDGWKPRSLVLTPDVTVLTEKLEGFDVIKITHGPSSMYEVPQLNFFPVVTIRECTSAPRTTVCGTWLSNIRIGEQPIEFFRPPSDQAVVPRSDPGGITRTRDPRVR
jgi:hypothetical protein